MYILLLFLYIELVFSICIYLCLQQQPDYYDQMKQHLRAVGSFFMRSGLGEKALHIDVYDELRARLSLNCTDSEDLMLEYFRHLAVDVVSA